MVRKAILLSALTVASALGVTSSSFGASDDEGEIRLSTEAKPVHEWLKKDLSDAAFKEDAAQAALKLAQEKLDDYELAAITDAIKRDPNRAALAFAACLNPKNCADPKVRLGAVKGIGYANVKLAIVSKALAAVVISETDQPTRTAAVGLLKGHKDPIANKALVDYYLDAFDSDGVLVKADHERVAVAAMRDVGGRQIYEALMAYVTMEVHAGSATEAAPPQTVYITNGGDIHNPAGSVNLPIELPNLELKGYNGTLVVPALGALKQVTGQNFGRHLDRWQNWIAKQD